MRNFRQPFNAMYGTYSRLSSSLMSLSHRSAVSALFFIHGLCFASWAGRIPSLQEKLQLSPAALGGILLALPAGFMISLSISGWLIGKVGSKKMAVITGLLYVLTLLGIGAAGNTIVLASSLVLFGFFGNLLNISMNTQAVFVEAMYKRKLMATFHGLWSLGGVGGAAISALMIGQAVSPLRHYVLICLFALVAIIVSGTALIKKEKDDKKRAPFFSMPDKPLLMLGIIAFCSMIAEGAMFDWSGVFFNIVVRVEPHLTGTGYASFMIAMAGTRFLADRLTMALGLKTMLKMSGTLTMTGLLLAVIFPYYIPSMIGFFLIGAGVSSVVPLVYSTAGKSKTLSAEAALTAVSSLGFMGLLVGPPIIGFIAEAFSLRISFLAIAVMAIAVIALSSLLRNEVTDQNK